MSSYIQISESSRQTETSQIMLRRNELTGYYKTQTLTEFPIGL